MIEIGVADKSTLSLPSTTHPATTGFAALVGAALRAHGDRDDACCGRSPGTSRGCSRCWSRGDYGGGCSCSSDDHRCYVFASLDAFSPRMIEIGVVAGVVAVVVVVVMIIGVMPLQAWMPSAHV